LTIRIRHTKTTPFEPALDVSQQFWIFDELQA